MAGCVVQTGWPSHLGWWPISAEIGEGARPTAALAAARPAPSCRRRGCWRSGARAGRQRGAPIWRVGIGRSSPMNKLYSEVWLARGEQRWGRRPGVVFGSSWCGEIVLGGVVLRMWSTRPKGG
jgi:hypothetical protein